MGCICVIFLFSAARPRRDALPSIFILLPLSELELPLADGRHRGGSLGVAGGGDSRRWLMTPKKKSEQHSER
jgi:hypothetical protein